MDVNIGKGITLAVDPEKFTPDVLKHVVYIGLRNILMDAHASITTETNPNDLADVARAVSEKKLAAMYAGEVRVASSREGDPIRAEAIRLCMGKIKTAWRKAGRKLDTLDMTAARQKAVAMINDEVLALAKARVEQARGLAGDVDVADLIGE